MIAETFLYFVVRIYHVYGRRAAAVNNEICFFYPLFDFLLYLGAAFIVAVYAYSSNIQSAGVFNNFIGRYISFCYFVLNTPDPFGISVIFIKKIGSVKNNRLKKSLCASCHA